ncbi:Hypothetical_protein [Hexamita inflata]|uniref:Hypothetical_protein n=1 Tax=Hexamita inflata TaxID=28002 RepID=A0AA86QK59_9EUKA|nr:Hypothetical protein HINF_LOCUS42817 [Hexamita inflata]
MLYNKPIQPKKIKLTQEMNKFIEIGASVGQLVCVYIDSKIQLRAEQQSRRSIQLLVCRLFSKPIYAILMWIQMTVHELQLERNLEQRQQMKPGNAIAPGYNIHYVTLLAAQPLCAIIKVAVGSTVIGPYHPYIFILLTIGVVISQDFLAEVILKLFNWFMQDLYCSCVNYFDALKRKRISILIKESIYTGTE